MRWGPTKWALCSVRPFHYSYTSSAVAAVAVLPRGNDSQDPRNFLLSGGARALDKEREKQKAQAAREKVKVRTPTHTLDLLHLPCQGCGSLECAANRAGSYLVSRQPRKQGRCSICNVCVSCVSCEQELKTASSALASELLRTRQESEREITALRDDMFELTNRFKSEQVGRR